MFTSMSMKKKMKKMSPPPLSALRTAKGFTLVEVLIAAVILAVALIGIAAIFPSGYKSVAGSGQMTMATVAAGTALDNMQNFPGMTNILNLNTFDTNNPNGVAAALAPLPAGSPQRTLAQTWAFALTGNAAWGAPGGSPQYVFGTAGAPAALRGAGNIAVVCLNPLTLPALNVIPCPVPPALPALVMVTVTVIVPERPGFPVVVTRVFSGAKLL